jgi:hypothetical protein
LILDTPHNKPSARPASFRRNRPTIGTSSRTPACRLVTRVQDHPPQQNRSSWHAFQRDESDKKDISVNLGE